MWKYALTCHQTCSGGMGLHLFLTIDLFFVGTCFEVRWNMFQIVDRHVMFRFGIKCINNRKTTSADCKNDFWQSSQTIEHFSEITMSVDQKTHMRSINLDEIVHKRESKSGYAKRAKQVVSQANHVDIHWLNQKTTLCQPNRINQCSAQTTPKKRWRWNT